RAGPELRRVERPGRRALERGRLLPPAVGFDDVGAPVAVDVAHAEAVREAPPFTLRRNRTERPRLGGIGRRLLGIAEVALGIADELGTTVTGNDDERRRVVVDAVVEHVPLPVPAAGKSRTARVLVPVSIAPRIADNQDVGPA